MELEDRTSRPASAATVMEGDGARSGDLRNWVLAVNVAMYSAVPLFFGGMVVGGRLGGALVFMSGSAIVFAGVAYVADFGGLTHWGAARFRRYQEWIARHRPGKWTFRDGQLVLLTRLVGATTALIGMAFCVVGIALIAGWFKPR